MRNERTPRFDPQHDVKGVEEVTRAHLQLKILQSRLASDASADITKNQPHSLWKESAALQQS